jgi:hypothetical protein
MMAQCCESTRQSPVQLVTLCPGRQSGSGAMRLYGWWLCCLLASCEETRRDAGLAPAEAAVAESAAPSAVAPTLPARPRSAATAVDYREAALREAQASYAAALARCALASDPANCEISATDQLEAAERAIRLEYEARLQEEAERPDPD